MLQESLLHRGLDPDSFMLAASVEEVRLAWQERIEACVIANALKRTRSSPGGALARSHPCAGGDCFHKIAWNPLFIVGNGPGRVGERFFLWR